ncbi:MAG: NAD(P)/FAD-dependent oxidoreductase, partial [Balneolales bacterium]|nr:NAD(P)/FAD-dependent oxidoreductase [Balneolales bacterium]
MLQNDDLNSANDNDPKTTRSKEELRSGNLYGSSNAGANSEGPSNLETQSDISLNLKSKTTPEASPKITLEATPEAIPDSPTDASHETTPKATPEVTPEATPKAPIPLRATNQYDAIVVGSGPNGLAAAVRLALEGLKVLVLEAESTIGGGTRTKALMEPAHYHDVCSAVHPLGVSSPFFRRLPLHQHGLEWLQPEIPVAHAFTPDKASYLHRDLQQTIEALGEDGHAYYKLVHQVVENWGQFTIDALGPLGIPEDPALLASFGLNAVQSARRISKRFKNPETRALFAGIAAHGIQPLDKP